MSKTTVVQYKCTPGLLDSGTASSGGSANVSQNLQGMFQRLEEVLFHTEVKEGFHPETVIETTSTGGGGEIDNVNAYGEFEDMIDYTICHRLARRLEKSLKFAKEQRLHCDIQVPLGLTSRVAQDIMRMSENEPCGLRGCVINVQFDDGSSTSKIDTITYDPNTVATHELLLTLQEDDTQFSFRKVLPKCFWRNRTIYLSAGYLLVKKKLYRRQTSLESLSSGDSHSSAT